jgi:hypothetical protein
MLAPKENAVGDKIEAAILAESPSKYVVPTKTYRGKTAQNNTTGAAIAANFAFEKKTDIKNDNVISDIAKRKKYENIKNLLLFGINEWVDM